MATSAPSQDDPWGWQAWAAAQPGNTVNQWQTQPISQDQLGAYKPELQQAGLWQSAWDPYANAQFSTETGNYAYPSTPADLSSLAGYTIGGARSSGDNRLAGLFDPSGNMVAGQDYTNHNSPTGSDYATMAAVVGGGVLGGYGLAQQGIGLGVGGAAGATAAAGTTAGATAADSLATAGAVSYPVSAGAVQSTDLLAAGAGAGAGAGATADTGALATVGQVTAPELAAIPTAGPALTASGVSGTGAAAAATTAATTANSAIPPSATTDQAVAPVLPATATLGPALTTASSMGLGQWAQLATSLYGLYQGNQLQQMGQNADPFAPYRAQYASQLNSLMQNPSSITSMPGYQAGLTQAEQTLTRNSASQGLTGSGTTAAALANAGANYEGTFFNNYLSQLSGLAGAGASGANGSMAGYAAGASLQNNSLNNLMKIWGTPG